MRFAPLLTIAVTLSVVESGFSQEDVTTGPQIGLHAGLTSWDLDDIEDVVFEKESGLTFGGNFGWGMSDWLGVHTRIDFTWINPDDLDSYTVVHWDFGIRTIAFLFGPFVRPYFELDGTFRFLELIEPNGFEISASGPGFGLWGGIYLFVAEQVALNAGFGGSIGSLEDISFGGFALNTDAEATSLRFSAGLTWFP